MDRFSRKFAVTAREEELHRWREREQPKVLPHEGVTAAWRSNVLPEQKRDGVVPAGGSPTLPTILGTLPGGVADPRNRSRGA
jgi:hypothetical protein